MWRSSCDGDGKSDVRLHTFIKHCTHNLRNAVRRKFYELYRLPVPSNPTAPLSRTNSPTTSPSNVVSPVGLANSHHPILSDPFTSIVKETVKLVQAALAIWGMFGTTREDPEVDGHFCDETKTGIFKWRRVMGMDHEESMRLEVRSD